MNENDLKCFESAVSAYKQLRDCSVSHAEALLWMLRERVHSDICSSGKCVAECRVASHYLGLGAGSQ